jgi:hypothetical protein
MPMHLRRTARRTSRAANTFDSTYDLPARAHSGSALSRLRASAESARERPSREKSAPEGRANGGRDPPAYRRFDADSIGALVAFSTVMRITPKVARNELASRNLCSNHARAETPVTKTTTVVASYVQLGIKSALGYWGAFINGLQRQIIK